MAEQQQQNTEQSQNTQELFKGVPTNLIQRSCPKYLVESKKILRIEEVIKHDSLYFDQVGTVAGWSRTIRSGQQDTLVFIELYDGSCQQNFQVVVSNTMPNFQEVLKCGVACSFRIVGTFAKSPAKGQTIEMAVNDPAVHSIKVFGTTDQKEYPLAKKRHNLETLREIQHLRPRSQYIGAITRVRSALAYATHLFFQNRGYFYVNTPILTSSDCEGAGAMFQATTVLPEKSVDLQKLARFKDAQLKEYIDYTKDFFKKPTFLTVSGQLALENYSCALSNVYTFGPTFRAEKSHTTKHLAEFWMLEPEMSFADVYDVMDLADDYVKFVINYALTNCKSELEFFEKFKENEQKEKAKQQQNKKGKDQVEQDNKTEEKALTLQQYLQFVVDSKLVQITYDEAIKNLQDAVQNGVQFEEKVEWGIDLPSEMEKYLTDKLYKSPVCVYNFPKDFKSFYMRLNEDGKTVAAFDILVPGSGELIGGSQREERPEVLHQLMKEKNLNPDDYWWYNDLRKYGTVPHGGFGLGFERLVMLVTGTENIKETIPFPRSTGNCEF